MNSRNMLKLIMIGDSSVGKTCMIMRYTDNQFTENFLTTVGVDFKVKELNIDGKTVKLQIWDTAGQEQFRTITKSYFRGADGIVLCFDLASSPTLERTKFWMDSIKESTAEKVDVVLVGNKSDKEEERTVTEEQARAFAEEYGVDYFETSAKTGKNINEVFETLARKAFARREAEPPVRTKTIQVTMTTEERKKGCC